MTNSQPCAERYGIERWGNGYFGVNEHGEVVVFPTQDSAQINLALLARQLAKQHGAPLLIRFPQIIRHRIHSLCRAFHDVMEAQEYQNDYVVAYPIKVNQQRQVIDAVIAAGDDEHRVGLEAGSKIELLAVLGMAEKSHPLIVCNGYKDAEYIRLALIGEQMGHHVYMVVEKLGELDLILQQAKQLGIRPRIGVRARLWSQATGKWQQSGGELSKFGLTPGQILSMVEKLSQHDMLDCLQLLHFHLGSQIANILDIQKSIRECVQFYRTLSEMGVRIQCFDVGGGLSIDYDGSHSDNENSSNYGFHDYAEAIVSSLKMVCDRHRLPHPKIISESGRAITAHHAVLITNIVDCEGQEPQTPRPQQPDDPQWLQSLYDVYQHSFTCHCPEEAQKYFLSAQDAIDECRVLFNHGHVSLEQRAQADRLYRAIGLRLLPVLERGTGGCEETAAILARKLATKVYANFSLFQSLPDAWAIDQIFPISPLSHLNQPAEMHAVIQDITCDSDGEMAGYVDGQEIQPHLGLPRFDPEDPYLLGFFLVGAYQEILGDMHNLFGDTNSFDVTVSDNGQLTISHRAGDNGATLLKYVDIQPEALLDSYRRQLSRANIDSAQRSAYLSELEEGLFGYSYLEANDYDN